MDTFEDLVNDEAEFKRRFATLYNSAVDSTEREPMYGNSREKLSITLEVLEYLRGENDDDPLDGYFGDVIRRRK